MNNRELCLKAQAIARTLTYNEEPQGSAKRVIDELVHRLWDAAPVADGAVAFRWKSGGTANKPRWVYAEAGSKSIPPVGAHPLFTHPQDASGDAERFAFVVDNNWIATGLRCSHKIQDSNIESARVAIDAAMQAKEAK